MVIDVVGEVFAIEVKEIKEKVRYTFYITDYKDSIMVSAYVTDKWSANLATIDVGDSISVKGEIKFDTFTNEVIISSVIDGISLSETVFRKKYDFDETLERTELHVHSTFTAQDGLTTVEEYFANAKKYGINALAITDMENVQAYPSIASVSKKHGIKPIYGVELNVVDEDEFKVVYERNKHDNTFVALDIETTGFSSNYDEITEISAFKVVNGEQKEYSVLCKLTDYSKLTKTIQELTSITPELLQEEGIEIEDALKGLKPRPIKTMIIGIPNAGKSTIINGLVNKKVATIGDKPGVTKSQQWIRINQDLELLDTPGILWPKFENQEIASNLAITGAIKDEIVDLNTLLNYTLELYLKHYPLELVKRYEIKETDIVLEIIKKIAASNNLYNVDKTIDIDRVALLVLNDIRSSRLGKVTLDRF